MSLSELLTHIKETKKDELLALMEVSRHEAHQFASDNI